VGYEDFRTNIFEQIEGVQKFIKQHCRKKYAVNPDTARREPVYEWPLLAIREALSNAIAHRDYMISGHTDIAIFDDLTNIKREECFLRLKCLYGILISVNTSSIK